MNGIISHISWRRDARAVNHSSWPPRSSPSFFRLLSLISLSKSRPLQHASAVTFSHECHAIQPHRSFKSMQITTSKSSSASFETELCTCGDRGKRGRGRGGGAAGEGHIQSSAFCLILACVCVAIAHSEGLAPLACLSRSVLFRRMLRKRKGKTVNRNCRELER